MKFLQLRSDNVKMKYIFSILAIIVSIASCASYDAPVTQCGSNAEWADVHGAGSKFLIIFLGSLLLTMIV